MVAVGVYQSNLVEVHTEYLPDPSNYYILKNVKTRCCTHRKRVKVIYELWVSVVTIRGGIEVDQKRLCDNP